MSRALILIAQARFLNRPLTPEETAHCLAVWCDLAGGERVYVPERVPLQPTLCQEIQALRAAGRTWREVSRITGLPKDTARRLAQTEP